MNVEENQLMYYVALPSVFNEYGVLLGQFTKLQSGKIFGHISQCGAMAVVAHGDERITPHTRDSLEAYLEYVDGYKEGGRNV